MNDLADSLDKLRQEHLFRTRNIISSAQNIEPIINGKKVQIKNMTDKVLRDTDSDELDMPLTTFTRRVKQ